MQQSRPRCVSRLGSTVESRVASHEVPAGIGRGQIERLSADPVLTSNPSGKANSSRNAFKGAWRPRLREIGTQLAELPRYYRPLMKKPARPPAPTADGAPPACIDRLTRTPMPPGATRTGRGAVGWLAEGESPPGPSRASCGPVRPPSTRIPTWTRDPCANRCRLDDESRDRAT